MIPDHVALPLEVLRVQLQRPVNCVKVGHHYVWNTPAKAGTPCLRCARCGELGQTSVWERDQP